jgi:putative membrane protein
MKTPQFVTLSIALPALALLAGCGSKTETNTTITNTGSLTEISTDTDNGLDNVTVATPAMTGQEFANAAASTDAYEIAAAKLAKTKATNGDLKDFAAMMITGHTGSTEKLKAAAAKAEPAIVPDAGLTLDQKANIATLESATGADFDAAYKSQQVAAHQKALAAMQSYGAAGDVPSLKNFASDTAPVVQKHLDKIQGM